MTPQEQELYELEHSDRFQTYIKAAAVADGTWHMAIALGNTGVTQQSRYFEIKKRVERLYCETNDWNPADLTDYQRQFISERLANEAVRFLAASTLAAQGQRTDPRQLKAWMDAHTQVETEIAKGGKLPPYEQTPIERARSLQLAVELTCDEFDFLRHRANQNASHLTDDQRTGLHGKLQEARDWINEVAGLIDGTPAEQP